MVNMSFRTKRFKLYKFKRLKMMIFIKRFNLYKILTIKMLKILTLFKNMQSTRVIKVRCQFDKYLKDERHLHI